MPREYRHIEEYEKEILQLWEQGKTLQEISEQLGFLVTSKFGISKQDTMKGSAK